MVESGRRRRVSSRLMWLFGTTGTVYPMLTVLMPAGAAGIPWMGLVFLVFVVEFFALLICEESALWNGAIAFCFWLPMVALHLISPGMDSIEKGTVVYGAVDLLAVAVFHAFLQSGMRFLFNWKRPSVAI